MKNVTIKIDDELARWARMWAAEHETSISQMIADILRQRMFQEQGYGVAEEQWLAWEPRPLRQSGERLPTREELHDR